MISPAGIKSFYKNIKLREKIFINYLFLCIVPLAVISCLNYNTVLSHTNETMTDFVNLFASQLNSEIEGYVASVDNISKSVVNDTNALDFLSREKEYLLYDRITYRKVIENYIHNMTLQKPDVRNIYIIGASEIVYYSGNPDRPLDIGDFENLDWFHKILGSNGNLIITPMNIDSKPSDNVNSQSLIIGRSLRDFHGTSHGVIAYEAKIGNIIKTNPVHEQIISEYDIGIEVSNISGDYLYKIPSKALAGTGQETAVQAIVLSSRSPKYGLNISILIPKKTLFRKLYLLRNLNLILVLAMILLTILLSLLLSHTITKPLSRLAKSMKLFENQQYDLIPATDRSDELGSLTQTYNRMISKINTLINEVYITKLHEKKAQFAALQNQINPHMLYNTIECIRMKAALNNDAEVSDMIRDLGRIFQLTLSKGKTNNTVGDEIEYITTYIKLFNIRHDNRYQLDIRLSGEIMEASIIRFSFQPIVENCIVHGFHDILGKCIISIHGTMEGNNILLTIKDNGNGMDAEKLSELKQKLLASSDTLNDTKSGIGLKNVYDRIKLEYGEEYYLNLHSVRMEGTAVEMLIPYRKR